jgi:putative restriction endonuclease
MESYFDAALREASFKFLRSVQSKTGGPIRFEDVASFQFDGQRVPLMDRQRGIRKPHFMDAALSFRTVHAPKPSERPYDDSPGEDGFLRYKWRGEDPLHPENQALRAAFIGSLPLIWFQGIASGTYLPIFPVWLAGEEPERHQFVVALEHAQLDAWRTSSNLSVYKEYATRVVAQRLHQPVFRARVLRAYDSTCAICRFRHPELLDAAHIRPDAAGGEPVVTNGISLCKLHHAAFDNNFLGIDADFKIHIRSDLMLETDGPTLKHSLQEVHHSTLTIPRARTAAPDRELLDERFAVFKKAG